VKLKPQYDGQLGAAGVSGATVANDPTSPWGFEGSIFLLREADDQVLAHELAHLAMRRRHGMRYASHGPRFRRMEAAIVAAFGIADRRAS
jgi:hypothetical protein